MGAGHGLSVRAVGVSERDLAVAGVGDEVLERPAHVGQQILADHCPVHGHAQTEREETFGVPVGLELVGVGSQGPSVVAE